MNIWYEQLFDVQVEHDYFADGACPDFEFFPTADTQRLLQNYALVMKPAGTGFAVFARLDSNLSANSAFITARRMDQPFRLIFGMRLKNKLFANYTDFPDALAPRQLLFLSNRVQVAGSDLSHILLGETQSAGGHVSANDLAFAAGDIYRWSFATAIPDAAVQLTWTGADGAAVLQNTFDKDEQGVVEAVFDKLFELPNAYYRISTLPNVPAGNRTVFKHPELAESPPFGIVEIRSHPAIPANSFRSDDTVVVNGQNVPVTRIQAKPYRVRFQRRSLPWKFQLVRNTASQNLANWSVQYGAAQSPYPAGVVFTGAPADAGTVLREFASNVPIPFFQTPKSGIQLQASGQQPLPNLPNPAPQAIKQDNLGNLYAESIIYI